MLGPTGNPRIARSLDTLRAQLNAAFPNRDKSWDGDIGDAAHQARKSDHNPDEGVVRALDVTSSPAKGLDGQELAEALRASRDPRISYVIHRGRIFSSSVSPWEWRARNQGPEDHLHHVHVSVKKQGQDDTQPWSIPGHVAPQPQPSVQHDPDEDNHSRHVNTNIIATMFADNQVAYGDVSPGWNDRPGVALPARFASPRPKLWIRRNGKVVRNVPIIDKGPHYDGTASRPADPYWDLGSRPRAETAPGKNGAGIDFTPPLDAALACQGKCRVDWGFEPMEDTMIDTPVPVPPVTAPPPSSDKLDEILALLKTQEAQAVGKSVMRTVFPLVLKFLPMLGLQGGIWTFVLNFIAVRRGWIDPQGVTAGVDMLAGGAAGSGLIAWASRGLDRLAKFLDKNGGK